ncbi:caveolin-1-like [Strongylocentrotus purpuratus]|uniref:Caveolin n=1 Tax=Strongylocentrotus purpuratus TaxID=7668 RepID=A0A7M7PLL3_STRPU|nr:caveolin-1-like [Strongylocentrotus purpuratus]XP_030852903.1 caveolin-1-like [Strongylocentrotus purpuratus]
MEMIHPENGPSGTVQVPPIQGVDQSDIEDVYRLSPHVTTGFADTFKESKDIVGFSFMEKVNGAIYKYTHFAFYAVLNLLLAPLMAFSFGLSFAVMHFAVVWFVQPSMKLYYVWLRVFNLAYEPALRLVCDPIHRSIALILSGIKVQFKMNSSDVKTSQV